MRLAVCLIFVLLIAAAAAAQSEAPTLQVPQSLALTWSASPPPAEHDTQETPLAFRPTHRPGSEVFLHVNLAASRDPMLRAAGPPGLASLACVRLFDSEGAEWQRHYGLGVTATSVAYALDDHTGLDRCLRSLAAGVLVGAAKELSDGYFDRRDMEATACGAAVTALLAAAMPRWEW